MVVCLCVCSSLLVGITFDGFIDRKSHCATAALKNITKKYIKIKKIHILTFYTVKK